jgi:F-type H+/Na+-transporting ATPase subunit beta
MSFWVYENWVRDKAMVHRADCPFCSNGNGLHGSRKTKSSTWHGPFDSADAALQKAKSCRKTRTEGCASCSPL